MNENDYAVDIKLNISIHYMVKNYCNNISYV